MVKKNKSMIGHDPLAWLKDDAEDAEITEVEEKPVSKAKKKTAKKAAAKSSTKAKSAKSKEITSDHVFQIQAIQDISSVSELHEKMKELFKNEKVIFDGQQVERIDAASLQLLFSFIQEAKVNDVDVAWRSPSEALSNSAKLLGMEEALLLNNVA